jgi:hypothetical protein
MDLIRRFAPADSVRTSPGAVAAIAVIALVASGGSGSAGGAY